MKKYVVKTMAGVYICRYLQFLITPEQICSVQMLAFKLKLCERMSSRNLLGSCTILGSFSCSLFSLHHFCPLLPQLLSCPVVSSPFPQTCRQVSASSPVPSLPQELFSCSGPLDETSGCELVFKCVYLQVTKDISIDKV